MTVIEPDKTPYVVKRQENTEPVPEESNADRGAAEGKAPDDGSDKPEKPENAFSDENIEKDMVVDGEQSSPMSIEGYPSDVVITPGDKLDFIDSVVNNTRYMRDYSLFGGRITLTVRSITVDETNALAAWTARVGTRDSAGLVSGRYRKYLAAAQLARYRGVDMPPLEQPLFETLGSDGKTATPPGWLHRCDFWDGIPIGVFEAIMRCIANFDTVYATLCSKANDANFWNPDTP